LASTLRLMLTLTTPHARPELKSRAKRRIRTEIGIRTARESEKGAKNGNEIETETEIRAGSVTRSLPCQRIALTSSPPAPPNPNPPIARPTPILTADTEPRPRSEKGPRKAGATVPSLPQWLT
jgi:hypothetical protein